MPIIKLNPELCDEFWKFVRGDLETEKFESRLYSSKEVEDALGAEEYLKAISVNFRDAKEVADFKSHLNRHLTKPADCDCHAQPDGGSVGLGVWPSGRFEVIEREIDGLWWLHRMECRECKTIWQVAAEERIYDVWLLDRDAIANRSQIRTYFDLLVAAKISGAVVHYVEPSVSLEIPAAIQDLAEETPGIACSEIEKILPVDAEIVRQHARDVASRHHLEINFVA